MTKVYRTVMVPYTPAQMFDLVAEVDQYADYMPWCEGAQILSRDEKGMVASIVIGYGPLNHSFTTRNTHDYPNRIDMELVNEGHPKIVRSPFASLTGTWQFIDMQEKGCRIEYDMDYSFRNRALSMLIGPVFNGIANSLIDSFIKRANELYG